MCWALNLVRVLGFYKRLPTKQGFLVSVASKTPVSRNRGRHTVLSVGLCMHTYAHTYPYRYTCIHTLCMLPIQKEEGQEHKTFTKYNVSVYLVKF